MGVKLAAALGGSVELVPTNTASNYTVTFPASTGTVLTTTSPKAGNVIQVQSTTLTTVFSSTSSSFTDVTGLSVAITPTSSSSKILIFASVAGATSTTVGMLWQLVRNSTAIDVGTSGYSWPTTGGFYPESGPNATNAWSQPSANFLDSPATTSAVTYKVQGRTLGGTFYINRRGAGTDYNATSTITVMEIAV